MDCGLRSRVLSTGYVVTRIRGVRRDAHAVGTSSLDRAGVSRPVFFITGGPGERTANPSKGT
jgi:hypothetical protein